MIAAREAEQWSVGVKCKLVLGWLGPVTLYREPVWCPWSSTLDFIEGSSTGFISKRNKSTRTAQIHSEHLLPVFNFPFFVLPNVWGVPRYQIMFQINRRVTVSEGRLKINSQLCKLRTLCKHRKNCECCPVSQLIVRTQRLSWIQVLNCQIYNQCLKCQNGKTNCQNCHKKFSVIWIVKIFHNCQNCKKL